jgi:IS5 family transposase
MTIAAQPSCSTACHLPPAQELIADRGYDSDAFRVALHTRGTTPCIPSRKHRKQPITHDAILYR